MFVSIKIFKNLWITNHYIFYMQVNPTDSHDRAIVHKRYNDFEEFHRTIKKLLA